MDAQDRRRILWIAVPLAVLAVAGVAFLAWAYTPLGPSAEAVAAMRSDALVTVTSTEDGIEFAPASVQPTVGLVFYPGGRIDPRSYAPYAREVASHGYRVVIVPMPLNLAVFGSNRAAEVIAEHAGVAAWALGGHSLGGAMAARYAGAHRGQVRGLVLLASYPPDSTLLPGTAMACASVYGTLDPGAQRIRDGLLRLPADTDVVAVAGGNHAQFGSYGQQPGDASATVPPLVQRAAAVRATVEVLRGIAEGADAP